MTDTKRYFKKGIRIDRANLIWALTALGSVQHLIDARRRNRAGPEKALTIVTVEFSGERGLLGLSMPSTVTFSPSSMAAVVNARMITSPTLVPKAAAKDWSSLIPSTDRCSRSRKPDHPLPKSSSQSENPSDRAS